MFAAAATDMNPKLARERRQAPLQGADHARCDTRGMPIHAHHCAKGLEPEWVGKAAQQLVAAILMDNRFAHHRAEAGHAICQPPWHLSAMQRKIGASSSLCHLFSCESLAYFEMILSSNGCRWAIALRKRQGHVREIVSLVSLARLQKPRLRSFRHNGAVGLMRLELAHGSSCK